MKLLDLIKKTNLTLGEIKDICDSVEFRMQDLNARCDKYEYNYEWQDAYDEWDNITEFAEELLEDFEKDSNVSESEIKDKGKELADMIQDFQDMHGGLSRWQA